MDRKDFVLAVLSTARGAPFRPVQVQKLFFLIDKKIPQLVDGPHYDFQPYSYGPFDRAVYDDLEELAREEFVDIFPEYTWRAYKLSVSGQKRGDESIATLPPKAQAYVARLSAFVRQLSFSELVSAIYREFPEMAVNSVFRG